MSPWGSRGARRRAGALLPCSGSGSGDGGSEGAGPDAGSQATSSTELSPFTGGDFYQVPDQLPDGDHGTLIRYQPVDDLDVAGASAWRIMYLSEDVGGGPIAVTGTALVPSTPASGDGRPVLTIAHGTTGIADQCAPSTGPGRSELALMGPAVEAGHLVAMSDYEGLGTPAGIRTSWARARGGVLDAARPRASSPTPTPVTGWRSSNTRRAVTAHCGLASSPTSGHPSSTWSGRWPAPPATELPVIVRAAGSPPIAGFLYMIIAGIQRRLPRRRPRCPPCSPPRARRGCRWSTRRA